MVNDTNELFTQDLKYEEFRSTIIDRRVNMERRINYNGMPLYLLFPREIRYEPSACIFIRNSHLVR